MGLPRLAAAVLMAAALTPAAAWAEGDKDVAKQGQKPLSDDLKKKLPDDAYTAMMRKKFLACKKLGDCKPYLLEKEKAKIGRGNKEDLAAVEAVEAEVRGADLGAAEGGAAASPGAPASAPTSAPTAAQSEAAQEEAEERSQRTMSRATGAAESLRRSLRPAEDAGTGGGAPEPGFEGGRAGGASSAAPGETRSVAEMALAARSGYAETFRAQGLMVGAGPRGEAAIQRLDGTPATAPELARLSAALSAEPAALTRRPDFFQVLPREKFAELKRDYAERPALRSAAFKDIGMTGRGRDFQWSASCGALSGGCNSSANAGSYRKGQDVPPEDLKEVWKAVHEKSADEEEDGFDEYSDEDRRQAEAEDRAAEKLSTGRRLPANLAALLAKMGEMARNLGGEDDSGASSSGDSSSSGAVTVSGGEGFPSSSGGSAASLAGRPSAAARSVPPKEGRPSAPMKERTAGGRAWLWIVAGAGAGLLLTGLRRRG